MGFLGGRNVLHICVTSKIIVAKAGHAMSIMHRTTILMQQRLKCKDGGLVFRLRYYSIMPRQRTNFRKQFRRSMRREEEDRGGAGEFTSPLIS